MRHVLYRFAVTTALGTILHYSSNSPGQLSAHVAAGQRHRRDGEGGAHLELVRVAAPDRKVAIGQSQNCFQGQRRSVQGESLLTLLHSS